MLTLSDQNKLAELLYDSGRAADSSRHAFCIEIGVELGQLPFRQDADRDFAIQLVARLLTTHNYDKLAKLCDEIEPDLGDSPKKLVRQIKDLLIERSARENDSALAGLFTREAATKDLQTRAELARQASDVDRQAQAIEVMRLSPREKLDMRFRMIKLEVAASGFEQAYARIRTRGGAALFALHPSLEYGGGWLLERIKAELSDTGTDLIKHQILDFSSATSWEFSFLKSLGGCYGIAPESDNPMPSDAELDRYRDKIIAKITSAPVGSRILIQIRQAERLFGADTQTLTWFLSRFWAPLVEAVNATIQVRKIIVLAMLVAEGNIPRKSLTKDRCCNLKNFDSMRMLELRLKPCTVEDIFEWLTDQLKLETRRAEAVARDCYHASKGKHLSIYEWVHTYEREALI